MAHSAPAAPARDRLTAVAADDIAALAAGAAIFGTGGGGAVYTAQIVTEDALRASGPVSLVTVDELGPDDLVILMSGIGAPTVGIEMLASADQIDLLVREAEAMAGRPITTRLSLGRTDLPIVVVGGAGFLVPEDLPGAGPMVRHEHGDVANAVGAAIALAGGRADQLSPLEDRRAAIERASEAAIAKAIEAGADPLEVTVVDVLETPVTYSDRPTVKVAVKATGPLSRLGGPIAARMV